MQTDPVAFEILRHRLQQVVVDMTKAVEKVSGSPVVIFAGDHMESIYDADGKLVLAGMACTHTTLPTGKIASYLLEKYGKDPGIFEGDQFFFNDPYISGIHNNDMAVVGPIHYEGELVGWSGAVTHCLDTGGTFPGGMSPWSRDVFQDGFRIPGLKLVDRGEIRTDVLHTLANLVRLPELITLDTKAKMAAINVAKQRIGEMCRRYGTAQVKHFFSDLTDYSEQLARKKLETIPDGEWESSTYLDDPEGGVFEIRCVMTKEGSNLRLDFSRSSAQSPYGINASASATMGGCFVGLAGFLFPHVPWNEGIYRVVDFVLPQGSVVNATQPAPVAANMPTGTSMLIESLIQELVGYMLYSVKEFRNQVYCPTWGASADFQMSGLDQRGRFYVTIGFNCMGAGGGARTNRDGCNTAGWQGSPVSWVPNVESSELFYPMLYLWRKELTDSGGHGKYRGGVGLEVALKLHDAGSDEARIAGIGAGFEPMTIVGLSGGYPAKSPYMTLVEGASYEGIPKSMDDIRGNAKEMAPKEIFTLRKNDVLVALSGPGGGGWADPLDRDSELVLRDVRDGYVTREAAREIYGVELESSGMSVDQRLTEKTRAQIHARRIKATSGSLPSMIGRSGDQDEQGSVFPLGESLCFSAAKGTIACAKCAHFICSVEDNWKNHVIRDEQEISNTQRFVLRKFFCPTCGTCLKVDMVRSDAQLQAGFRFISAPEPKSF